MKPTFFLPVLFAMTFVLTEAYADDRQSLLIVFFGSLFSLAVHGFVIINRFLLVIFSRLWPFLSGLALGKI
jgi:hypothetical protein